MTIVPNIAQEASKVTMLQRSPTYVVARPDQDAIANFLRKWLPSKLAYSITRLKNTWLQSFMYKRMRAKPEEAKRNLIGMTRAALNKDFDVKKHFTPSYYPWDQRLCLLPNGDLYESINQGRVDVITDTIDRVEETGILVSSGDLIEADIIVTATGNKDIVTADHMREMKDRAILCNIGHFDNEIQVDALKNYKWTEIKPQVHEIELPSKKRIILLAEGRLVNLGCATGHPSFVMSASFTNQVIAQIELWNNHKNYENKVYVLPKHLDEKVATLHLKKVGAKLTKLSKDQADYISVGVNGPFKPNAYRY